ncbi:MAG: hypothetical protein ABRQ27_11880 [Clostridiaceae bacterium]
MNRLLIIKLVILLFVLLGQSFCININEEKDSVKKNEVRTTHESSLDTLRDFKNIKILKESKSDSKISFDIVYSGTEEEILSMVKEFNSNRFINKINNLKIEKSETDWILSAAVEFSSYVEYTYNR